MGVSSSTTASTRRNPKKKKKTKPRSFRSSRSCIILWLVGVIVTVLLVKLVQVNVQCMEKVASFWIQFQEDNNHAVSSWTITLSAYQNDDTSNATNISTAPLETGFPRSTKIPAKNTTTRAKSQMSMTSKPKTVQEKAPPPPHALGLLFPPGMMGGFANQLLRFISLVEHAHQERIANLFLPSLWWTTQVHTPALSNSSVVVTHNARLESYPIPMEFVFDVQEWNGKAQQLSLPRLIDQLPEPSPCWQTLQTKTNNPTTRQDSGQAVLNKTALDIVHALSNHSMETKARATVWPPKSMLEHYGFVPELLNETVQMMTSTLSNPRRRDFLARVKHCENTSSSASPLVLYGGGTMGGRLWNEAMRRHENTNKHQTNQFIAHSALRQELDARVRLALQPAPQWARLAEQCVQSRIRAAHAGFKTDTATENANTESDNDESAHFNYVALHARIELEMMGHNCGKSMEQSLERILQHVKAFLDEQQQLSIAATEENPNNFPHPRGLLLVVGRAGIVGHGLGEGLKKKFAAQAAHNAQTLARYVTEDGHATKERLWYHQPQVFGSLRNKSTPDTTSSMSSNENNSAIGIPIFECGSFALQEYYDNRLELELEQPKSIHSNKSTESSPEWRVQNYGTLVEAVTNFHSAVQARIFIGVKGSSYSNAIWTTRFLMGKGSFNFYYTKGGRIAHVENQGYPDRHVTCK